MFGLRRFFLNDAILSAGKLIVIFSSKINIFIQQSQSIRYHVKFLFKKERSSSIIKNNPLASLIGVWRNTLLEEKIVIVSCKLVDKTYKDVRQLCYEKLRKQPTTRINIRLLSTASPMHVIFHPTCYRFVWISSQVAWYYFLLMTVFHISHIAVGLPLNTLSPIWIVSCFALLIKLILKIVCEEFIL